MKKGIVNRVWLFCALSFICQVMCAEDKVSICNYLDTASSGISRYWALYNAHIEALKSGKSVDYKHVKRIDIEIPADAKTIPLTSDTDFKNIKLTILNNKKNGFFLFDMINQDTTLSIKKEDVDIGDFSYYPKLRNALVLLNLEDETPWVKNRKGYKYGHVRKDILLINRGKAINKPSFEYNTEETKVIAKYCYVSPEKKCIRNLKMYRSVGCSAKTYMLNMIGQYNVDLENIEIHTPPDDKLFDYAIITISDCCNITLRDVWIDGTYSSKDHSGYGISMNNVYDSKFYKLRGHANWGIFGNNNINKAYLKDCDINRFDIHCYGSDIKFDDCKFRDLYNQLQSISDSVVFNGCEFFQSAPYLVGGSYNAYTKCNVVFRNCIVHPSKKWHNLIQANALKGVTTNERKELSKQQYPNLYIDGLTIDLRDYEGKYCLYSVYRDRIQLPSSSIPTTISFKNLKIIPESATGRVEETNLGSMIDYDYTRMIVQYATIGGGVLTIVLLPFLFWYNNKKRKESYAEKNTSEYNQMSRRRHCSGDGQYGTPMLNKSGHSVVVHEPRTILEAKFGKDKV